MARSATHIKSASARRERPRRPDQPELGGGLYSTAGDYLQFVRMILNRGSANGSQVLQPATVDLMAQNAMGDIRVTMLETQTPERSLDAEFFPGLPKSWGLSFMIKRGDGADRPAGGQSRLGRDPEHVLLDRSHDTDSRGLSDADPAVVEEKALAVFYDFETAVCEPI